MRALLPITLITGSKKIYGKLVLFLQILGG